MAATNAPPTPAAEMSRRFLKGVSSRGASGLCHLIDPISGVFHPPPPAVPRDFLASALSSRAGTPGPPRNLIRMSVGLEHPAALIADLDR